uniref:Uncharacterized protein n=1 Tax=Cajanus cajan TaxID=3821 RepID=A0A151SFC3_CAJCA|nr:hypothetical protein KK1_024426 [Cajanus cajan]
MTDEVFEKVGGLKRIGIIPDYANLKEKGVEIDKDVFFESMLKNVSAWEANKAARKRNSKKVTYNVGGLFTDDRLLHYCIVWILAARESNHAQISEHDMILMAVLKNGVKVLAHYEVPLESEAMEVTRKAHNVKDHALKMMKLTKHEGKWKEKDEVVEAEVEVEPEPVEKPLSTFKLAVLAKLDDIRESQRRDYDERKACFESIFECLDEMNIPYPDEHPHD